MNTKEAFAKLISKRAWYKDLGINQDTAGTLAKRFRDGAMISTDKLEEILVKAGWRVIRPAQWAPLGGFADPQQETIEIPNMVDRPDDYWSNFVDWNYLHNHMYPADVDYIKMQEYYDIYLRKVKAQKAEKQTKDEYN